MKKYIILGLFIMLIGSYASVAAKENDTIEKFKILKKIESTPIKNQFKTITCWSYTGIALIETELMRRGKGNHDLSEMFVVRQAYLDKAEHYLRMHGMAGFSGGGALTDVFNVVKKYGLIPTEAYNGLNGGVLPDHLKMDVVLKNFVDSLIKSNKIPSNWMVGFSNILDVYMGKLPPSFIYKGKSYTSRSFADFLDIRPDDYLQFMSFKYKPYYTNCIVEVPDNWAMNAAYNIQLDELIAILDNSINLGYTAAITMDNTEPGYEWIKGTVMITNPTANKENSTPDINITPEMRQQAFDNYETTDDHGVLIIGIAKDHNDRKVYIAKNSWGADTKTDGYLYISEAYIKYKTLTLMVNKSTVPKSIMQKIK
jgi:bleomycin hydrolase